jgi:hypothetical protein
MGSIRCHDENRELEWRGLFSSCRGAAKKILAAVAEKRQGLEEHHDLTDETEKKRSHS